MLGEPKKRISERAITVWRIRGIITSIISLIVFAAASFAIYYFKWNEWIIPIIAAVWILETFFIVFFNPKLRWRRWRYEVREQEIEIQHGLFVVTQTLIPMIRVQHVDNTQGPLLKKYRLSTMNISTAATVHEIPALDETEAEELRRVISSLARVADEDV